MQVNVEINYLKDGDGNKQIDFKNSGAVIFGIFANVEGIAIIVSKCYEKRIRWDVLDDFFIPYLDIDEAIDKFKEFKMEYGGRNICCFGNEDGNQIAQLSIAKDNDSKGYEVVDLKPESFVFTVQSNLKKIKFAKEIQASWSEELRNFDLKAIRENEKTYPRVFALGSVLRACYPYVNYLWC